MEKTEVVELTNMCMICDAAGNVLVQDKKNSSSWHGWNFPGGHVEPGEYVTPSVIREVREETGLTISHPHLCGVKQFPLEEGRYIVFLFETEEFEGDLRSSEEGTMHWIDERELSKVNLVEDFEDLIEVMLDDELMEFQYVIEDGEWLVIKR